MTRRPSAEITALKRHLSELKRETWLGPRRWWPDYLFHCTDIRNVLSILNSGELLSRVRAKKTDRLKVDIASPEIIGQTDVEWQDYVRLYFRPRTPTQYNNEGFRPKGQWKYDAHCPVPVYLLLNAVSVLSRAECRFTDGNVAAGAVPMDRIDDLREIPFRLIYHDSRFEPSERSTIVYHRNAEVLVPRRLDLGAVRWIFCRSQAEYNTLLHLLPPGARARWVDKIGVRQSLFHNQWTFVQQTEMNDERLIIRFNPETQMPGPFDACIRIVELPISGPKQYTWRNDQFQTKPHDALLLDLRRLQNSHDYRVRFFLDEQLAFAGRYQREDMPF